MPTKNEDIVAQQSTGPWHIDAYDALGLGVWRHTIKNQHGNVVAQVHGDGTNEQPGPIARLIAAAPTMYALLADLRMGCGMRGECRARVTELLNRIKGNES